jgi:hypothetical protein
MKGKNDPKKESKSSRLFVSCDFFLYI